MMRDFIARLHGKSAATMLAVAAWGLPACAAANVYELSPQGFVVRHQVEVPVSASEAWDVLVRPAKWWSNAHSFSGQAKNLSLDARAGGCFCEVLPNPSSPNASPRGSVEHMRVVYAEQGRALRMTGALGPLQPEAVNGTLTVFLKPAAAGSTQIMWEYVVGGYLRTDAAATASGVDRVLGEQVVRLARALGAKLPEPAAASPSSGADGRGGVGREAASGPEPERKGEPAEVPEEVRTDRRFEGR